MIHHYRHGWSLFDQPARYGRQINSHYAPSNLSRSCRLVFGPDLPRRRIRWTATGVWAAGAGCMAMWAPLHTPLLLPRSHDPPPWPTQIAGVRVTHFGRRFVTRKTSRLHINQPLDVSAAERDIYRQTTILSGGWLQICYQLDTWRQITYKQLSSPSKSCMIWSRCDL